MNIFDAIGKTTFDVMRTTFGNSATWLRENITATVLYKHPSHKVDLSENDYMSEQFQMEYYETDFPGLLESVSNGVVEKVTIEVSKDVFEEFGIRVTPKRKGDGKTVVAILVPLNV